MRLLVTNDDGIEAEGLHVLARHLVDAGHEVIIAAPDCDVSGAGASLGRISTTDAIEVTGVEIDGLEGVPAYAVSGPPGLCIVAARLGAFGPVAGFEEPGAARNADRDPVIIVSGINPGLNTARTVLHSGTVGAALTGQNFGLSGLAVSIGTSDPWHWDTAARLAVEVVERLADAPPRTVLNLNVPGVPFDDLRGIRWARLAPFGSVRFAVTAPTADGHTIEPGTTVGLELSLVPTDYEPEPDTDQGVVQAGYAALTTLVGVAEAWDPEHVNPAGSLLADQDVSDLSEGSAHPRAATLEIHPRVVPGAPLEPVHRIPDASDPRTLRRPEPAADPVSPT